jgi:hypothetical protein
MLKARFLLSRLHGIKQFKIWMRHASPLCWQSQIATQISLHLN